MASLREQAGLPKGAELTSVTLQTMRRMSLPATNEEINTAVADALGLSADQRAVKHGQRNQTELAYRVAWARSVMRVAGATDRPARALWTLTEEGRTISVETVEQRYRAHLAERAAERKDSSPDATEADASEQLPEVDDLDWSRHLLEQLMSISPSGFEHLTAALLRSAGFDDVEVTGRSSDGGIDGIGTYRPSGLISFHTAFQCKRYQGSVGASVVRDFRGSFIGRADRGIIVTTGYFTRDARAEASRPGANPVDLIDGEALCDLLKEHQLGVRVTQRMVEDITIDDAYFERLNP